MIGWSDVFYFSVSSAALLLSLLGLWLTAIVPGIDRWNKRFFLGYFAVLGLSCLLSLIVTALRFYPIPIAATYIALALESLLLSLPFPMLTVYLLHCCGESLRSSRLLHAALCLWAIYFILLASGPFIGGFVPVAPESQFYREPLYPLMLLPMVAVLLLNLIGLIRRQSRLARKVFLGLLVALLPMTAALGANLFVDVVPVFDISVVVSALAMYGLVLSDQIERDMRQQQEIANQRASITVLRMRPHFIYNTLMSIYSLCNIDPQKARQVTSDFTDYLRKNFNAVASDSPVTFSTELEHTHAYLAVEQAQYEDALIVDYDAEFTRFRLPPLTLQPLAENAVKHGMGPDTVPLHVSIRTRETDSDSEIIVEDDGPGFDPAIADDPHTTLANIRQRLESMCDGRLDIAPREGGGTTVRITVPR